MADELRICPKCKGAKTSDQFYRCADGRVSGYCKPCQCSSARAWRREHHARALAYEHKTGRGRNLRRRYGVSEEQYADMLKLQDERCAICNASEPGHGQVNFAVDHDHITGCVRSLLCHRCNLMLGAANDSEELLSLAVKYLHRHGGASNADK